MRTKAFVGYSDRIATIGWTEVARRAAGRPARIAQLNYERAHTAFVNAGGKVLLGVEG